MVRRLVLALAWAALAGCGSDYLPPDLPTTGAPAGPLGQVLDLDVVFPNLTVGQQPRPGVAFEMRVEIERTGFGEFAARVAYGSARLATAIVPIEDLSDGRTSITVTPDRWASGRLGPLRIDDATFEMMLDGSAEEEGWRVAGRALGSRSLDNGSFVGFRRHRFLVAGTDFLSTSGRLAEVVLVRETEVRVRHGLGLVSSDPVLGAGNSAVFVVNRLTFDNLQRLDPERDFATSWQRGVGAGSNPQYALRLSDERGYLSRYEPPYNDVAVFSPADGTILGSIPLETWAENPDGTPRPTTIVRAAGAVFVALQDVDRSFMHYAEGKLAVIDPDTDRVIGTILLGGRNPLGIDLWVDAGGREKLYVALAGIFPGTRPQELSGGVVVVDALNRVVDRMALDDDVAGGNIGAVAIVRESLGYATVSDERFVNRVVAFDPRSGSVLRTVVESDELIPTIAADGHGVLAVPDRRFFEPQTCLYRVPIDEGASETRIHCAAMELPPFSLVALD
ncbi:MAG TPA: hypothetical protein VD788_05510 [Candidatus Polarisedimenticolaceae bacterium]|nr:hypothetical protein [Candidatus Polarisedimenticolaceae bacterium]